jgi:hypothetical protein
MEKKQVKNKSCVLWPVLEPSGYTKNIFSYFYYTTNDFYKILKIIFRDSWLKSTASENWFLEAVSENRFSEAVDLIKPPKKVTFFRDGWHKRPLLKIAFSDVVLLTEPPLKMNIFLEADFFNETAPKNWFLATVVYL